MENKKNWVGYSFTTIQDHLKKRRTYNGELEESKNKLQSKICNLIKEYEERHKVNLFLERNKEGDYYIWLFIDLDISIW